MTAILVVIKDEEMKSQLNPLASCQFRVIASGTITKKESTLFGNIQYYKVKIDAIGVYVKDSFDFITKDEYLGDWSPKNNSVKINPYLPAFIGYTIENKSYREYYNKGMDYNLYSNIKKVKVDYEFTATTIELE